MFSYIKRIIFFFFAFPFMLHAVPHQGHATYQGHEPPPAQPRDRPEPMEPSYPPIRPHPAQSAHLLRQAPTNSTHPAKEAVAPVFPGEAKRYKEPLQPVQPGEQHLINKNPYHSSPKHPKPGEQPPLKQPPYKALPRYRPPPPRKWFPQQTDLMKQGFYRGGKTNTISDRQIYLNLHEMLRGYNIGISVNDGNVSLQGVVNSQEERQIIEDEVAMSHGVRNVNNQLTVANTKIMPKRRMKPPRPY